MLGKELNQLENPDLYLLLLHSSFILKYFSRAIIEDMLDVHFVLKFSLRFQITYDVIHEFAEDNVKYLELRTTPREDSSTGMTRETYVEAVLRAIDDCREKNLDIMVKLLLAIDRRGTLDTANDTVELALKYR